MRLRRIAILLACLGLAMSLAPSSGAEMPGDAAPRLANVYWRGLVDDDVIQALSQWDVVVLNSVWTHEQLTQLRNLSPDIRIFFAVNFFEMPVPGSTNDAWKIANTAYANDNDLWWYNVNQQRVSGWPRSWMVNITHVAPDGPQGHWVRYFAARVEELVRSQPQLDGIFFDNFWKRISWAHNVHQFDSDCNPTHFPERCDGVPDLPVVLDRSWNVALQMLAAEVRWRFDNMEGEHGRPLALITNSSGDYFQWLNGTMHEYFPSGHANIDYGNPYRYNWHEEMLQYPGGYLVAPFRQDPYRVSILNAEHLSGTIWDSYSSPNFERHKRFCLVSSLLGDGYLSLDQGIWGHGNLWWEPEYDHAGRGRGYLGAAVGPPVHVLSPDGPEVLQNVDLGEELDPWLFYTFDAVGSIQIDTSTWYSWPASARIDITDTMWDGHGKLWQSGIAIEKDQPYTLSFRARSAAPTSIMMHLYSSDCPSSRCFPDRSFAVGPTWQRQQLSFTASETAVAALNIFVHDVGTVWLDDISLRQGDARVFRRDYEHGIVLLNVTNEDQVVNLGDTFYRLQIPGSDVFDGAAASEESIPPSDGRILLRVPAVPIPVDAATLQPQHTRLLPLSPNPLRPSTRVHFEIGSAGSAEVSVFDAAGRRVRTLLRRQVDAGLYQHLLWDGTDDRGRRLPSGVYFVRLIHGDDISVRKAALVR